MKLTKSQLKKIIKEELGDPEGEAEYEREKKARIAWKRKFTSVEEVEAIVDLMINDPEFRMLQGYAEEFKRRSQRGTPPQNALEGILPEYVPGGLINTIIVKARERLSADETRIERPKGTGASAADMERWQSDYRNESKQNTKMKLTKSQLKKIIQEEVEEWTYQEPELTPAQQTVTELCGQLTEAIYEMERSSPDMTDTYLILFRALAEKGLSLNAMAMMA